MRKKKRKAKIIAMAKPIKIPQSQCSHLYLCKDVIWRTGSFALEQVAIQSMETENKARCFYQFQKNVAFSLELLAVA